MNVINHGLNRAVTDDNGSLLFVTDLSPLDKWSCKHCGACCKSVDCDKLLYNGCSDYDSRPLVCRLFPLSIIRGPLLSFIKSPLCKGWGTGEEVDFSYWLTLMKSCFELFLSNSKVVFDWIAKFNHPI